jgi:hypothetical protein
VWEVVEESKVSMMVKRCEVGEVWGLTLKGREFKLKEYYWTTVPGLPYYRPVR